MKSGFLFSFLEIRKDSKEYKDFLLKYNQLQQQLKFLEEIFGFKLQFANDDTSNLNFLYIQVTFNEGTQSVVMCYDKREERFAFTSMQPQHPNFSKMQDFLLQSQDVAGLMAHLNVYFSTLLSSKI